MSTTGYVQRHRAQVPAPLRYLADLWQYRHLCFNLVGSDLRSRFRRSTFGVAWGVAQPLLLSLLLAWVFSAMFNAPFAEFWIYVLSGFIIWDLIVTTANVGLGAIEGASGYLRQARIPLLVFQLRVALSSVLFFGFGLAALVIAMAATGYWPPIGLPLLQVIPLIVIIGLFALPVSILTSLVGVSFRDARYILPLVLQLVFLTSPVLLPREVFAKPEIAILQFINPLMPLLDLARAIVIEGRWWAMPEVLMVGGWVLAAWVLAAVVAIATGRNVVFQL